MHFCGFRPSKTPPKFNEKTSRERQKSTKWEREREKKSAKFWAVRERGVWGRGSSGGRGPAEEMKKKIKKSKHLKKN